MSLAQLDTKLALETEALSQAESELVQGVRLVLKRRQRYMYDYFFPKNMRDMEEKKRLVAKYNGTLGNNLVHHNTKNQCELNQNGEQGSGGLGLHLNNHMDFSYVGDIYIGNNPPQKIRALFDTGSANTWVLNSKVKAHDLHFAYNDKSSSSALATP